MKTGYRIESTKLPMGDEYNALIGLLEKVLEENKAIRDELANLNCPHPLMTKKDVAEYLQVCVKSVENMIKRKELKVYKIGSLPRFKRSEVDNCLKRAEVKLYNPHD